MQRSFQVRTVCHASQALALACGRMILRWHGLQGVLLLFNALVFTRTGGIGHGLLCVAVWPLLAAFALHQGLFTGIFQDALQIKKALRKARNADGAFPRRGFATPRMDFLAATRREWIQSEPLFVTRLD